MAIFHKHVVRKHASQLWRFAVCGGIGATIDLGSLSFFVEVLDIPPMIAFLPSSVLASIFVFLANKYFTFKNRDRKYGKQMLKFLLVYAFSMALNIGLSSLFFWIGTLLFAAILREVFIAILAKVGAIGFGAIWNYILSHGFVFKSAEEADVVIV